MSQSKLSTSSAVGRQIKQWRRQRGLSQLQLAGESSMSQRHLSFVETGRSRPGEDVVLRIAESLALPLRERNELLLAAGLNTFYPETPLQSDQVSPFREAIARMLLKHEPYPAYVINRWWDVVDMNRSGQAIFPVQNSTDTNDPLNAVDTFLAPGPVRDMIENFDEVAWGFLLRLRREVAQSGPDEKLNNLLERAEAYLQDIKAPLIDAGGMSSDLVICPKLRIDNQIIPTVTMVARFGTARDVNLDELRIELVYPANKAAEAFFQSMQMTNSE